jgi:hypothetical protein
MWSVRKTARKSCYAVKAVGLVVVFVAALASAAAAECTCECVSGRMQPLCDSSIDLAPICPLQICPLVAPALPPLSAPTLPPLGTSSCQPARVCDTFGNCRWQQVCR